MDRREALKTLTFGTLAGGFLLTGCKTPTLDDNKLKEKFWDHVTEEDLEKWAAQFFTDHEFETVHKLADIIIPADDRSGSASDAGVPEFIDFMMLDRPDFQTPIRGGLNWLDNQCRERYSNVFIDCTQAQQKEILDAVAYPGVAKPTMQAGVSFFNRFRDLVAAGFWSSKIGIEDIQYLGNQPWHWTGCSHEALEHLGLEGSQKVTSGKTAAVIKADYVHET